MMAKASFSKFCRTRWRNVQTPLQRLAARFSDNNSNNNAGGAAQKVTASEITRDIAARFKAADVPEPELSARHLVASAAKLKFGRVKEDSQLSDGDLKSLARMVECRLARVPVQYIVGDWDFRSLVLATRPPVFIPRPETEQLVEATLERTSPGCRILDVGCGTGAVALSLLMEGPDDASVVAVDQSAAACLLTMENAVANGLDLDRFEVRQSKLMPEGDFEVGGGGQDGAVPSGDFDVIVSNPPYVLRKDLSGLEPEVSLYEDLRALDGGSDGLEVIRSLLKLSEARLTVGGHLLMETDPCHFVLLPQEMSSHDSLSLLEYRKDFNGKDRFAILQKIK